MPNPFGTTWASLQSSTLFWLCFTLGVYLAADWLCKRVRFPLFNPVLVSIAIVVLTLYLTGTEYDLYFNHTQMIHFLLGPATVALAIPLYSYVKKLRSMLLPITVGLLAGSLTAMLTAVWIGQAMGASTSTQLSLLPKSVTTPIAMGVAEKIGGLPSLTAVLVIFTGIVGAVCAEPLLKLLGIKDEAVRGTAIGLSSHGIGTARAFQMGEETGAFSGLGMGLNGILTAFLAPVVAKLLGL